MTNPIKIAASILTLAALVSLCFGADAYFAKSAQLAMVERRLDQKIVQDQVNYLQEQLWKIDDRFRDKPKDQMTIDRERRLQKQLKDAEDKLKRMKEKD